MEVFWQNKIKNPVPWILGLVTALGVGAVVITTYKATENPRGDTELTELTVPVQRKTLSLEISASGIVDPIRKVKISPQSSGRLIKLLVQQGDLVKKGQTLAVMKSTEIQAQGRQAQARLKEAIANLREAQIKTAAEIAQAQARFVKAEANLQEAQARIPREIEQAREQVRSAESRLILTRKRYERYKVLVQEGAFAQDRLDEAIKDYQDAQAKLREALKKLEELQTTGNPEIFQLKAAVEEARIAFEQSKKTQRDEILALRAKVESSQAALKEIEERFKETILIAPFDGIVTQKNATEGDIVSPSLGASSTSIVEISQGLKVVAKVPEIDVGQLKLRQPVKIIADAYPDRAFRGQVVLIAPEAIVEQNVTSFEVQIAVEPEGIKQLRSGMNVNAIFLGQKITDALVVPTVAIVTEEGKTGVLVPDEKNKPKFKPVTIGVTINNETQILKGLTPGERVFIDLPKEKKKPFG
ncbi:MAG: efflux RND transporter periplasmic adaptor subunit [Cyanobacteria bacterium J083]|nr:MAG: efflux RND transporter periplasmic adaptor subunit [Cyanobacteria bacterium J083]